MARRDPIETLALVGLVGLGGWYVVTRLGGSVQAVVQPIENAVTSTADAVTGAGAIVATNTPNIGQIAAEDVGTVTAPIDQGLIEPAIALITGQPRGVRDNNPTNILFDSRNAWLGATGTDVALLSGKVYVKFADPIYGIRAAMATLRTYAGEGFTVLQDIATRWVHGSAGNNGTGTVLSDMPSYIATLSAVSGLAPTDQLDTGDEQSMIDFVQGLIAAENGQQWATYYDYATFDSAWNLL